MIGLLTAVAVFCLVLAVRRPGLSTVVGRYVGSSEGADTGSTRFRIRIPPAVTVGAVTGVVVAPGGWPVGAVGGAVAGFGFATARSAAVARHRARRLGQELPTVADLSALYVLSGHSVVDALRQVVRDSTGIAASEISELLARVDRGFAFPEAAREAARRSAHRDGARFYELLAQAHRSGARLAEALEMFAGDRRAALERELTAEGGRRALAGYGPILGLMIPTTLVFLMYPTLAGLDALSSAR